jgi:hypothetical protein
MSHPVVSSPITSGSRQSIQTTEIIDELQRHIDTYVDVHELSSRLNKDELYSCREAKPIKSNTDEAWAKEESIRIELEERHAAYVQESTRCGRY